MMRPKAETTRALFLDRDGVINVDHGYVATPERCQFIDGIFELCRFASRTGYLIIIVTNQAGIGRGYYSEADFHAFMSWMKDRFVAENAPIAGVYFCPYHPVHGQGSYKRPSPRRKPEPGMIFDAQRNFKIDLAGSVLIGDKLTDIEAGLKARVGTNLLFDPQAKHGVGYEVICTLGEAARFLRAQQSGS